MHLARNGVAALLLVFADRGFEDDGERATIRDYHHFQRASEPDLYVQEHAGSDLAL
jgi:hypothetical protein